MDNNPNQPPYPNGNNAPYDQQNGYNQQNNGYGQQQPYGYGQQQPYGYGQQQPPYGAYNPNNQMMPKPSSNLVWAILTTLFCCLPFGIVAIVKASKVDSLWAAGDYMGAQQASDDAKKYSIIAAVISVVISVLYIIAVATLGFAI